MLHCKDFSSVVSNIGESIYCAESADFYTQSLDCSLKEALFSLRKSGASFAALSPAIRQIEKLKGKLFKQMYECVRGNPGRINLNVKFCVGLKIANSFEYCIFVILSVSGNAKSCEDFFVVVHGDLWVNNIMWRYDNRNNCDAVKFIDLQTMRYTSPAIDILHFLYTSTEHAMRAEYMDQLIDDYVDSLYSTLQKYDVHDVYVPNKQSLNKIIRTELRDRSMYGLGICMWLLPAVTFHPEKIVNLDTVTLDDFNSENHENNITQMQTPEYHARMSETVMEFYKKGILNGIT